MRSLLDGFKTVCAIAVVAGAILAGLSVYTHAGAPGIINYQGRVQVNGSDFTGSGLFKFALVDGTGTLEPGQILLEYDGLHATLIDLEA